MSATTQNRGIPIVWSVGSSTVTAFGTCKIQSRDYSRKAEKVEIKDANGDTFSVVYYDYKEKATWRYLPAAASSGSAVTITMPAIGDSFSVTDSAFTQISGGLWLVDDVQDKSTNESAMAIDVEATRYVNITS